MLDQDMLQGFTLQRSDDAVKTDLELTCNRCGFVVCDAEAGDTLEVLASATTDHDFKHTYTDRHVFIDSQVADADDSIGFDLGLQYVYLNRPWSGGEEPVTTEALFRRFISRQATNDRNGTWGTVTVTDGRLIHQRNDSDDPDDADVFERVSTGPAGEPLYAITGWTFYTYESQEGDHDA